MSTPRMTRRRPLRPAITASDSDNVNLADAMVQITGNYQSGQDVLLFTNTAKITGTWNAAIGMLTLSGSDTAANYQAALQSVKYQNTSENPSGLTRTVSFKISDGTSDSNLLTREIAVTPVNDAPVLAGIEGTALAYTENDPATAVTVSITASDVDNANLAGATVQITGNYQNGQDVLAFTNTGEHHRLLERGDRDADPERQRHGGQLPGGPACGDVPEHEREPERRHADVSFKVSDGAADSNSLTRDIAVTPVNDAPVLAADRRDGARLHRERRGDTAITVHDHGQRCGQHEPDRGHGPDHGQLPERAGRARRSANTANITGTWNAAERDADPERQRTRWPTTRRPCVR